MIASRRSPFAVAREIGRRAAIQGRSAQSNPYDGRAYRAAWLDGYHEQKGHQRTEAEILAAGYAEDLVG